MTPEEHFAGHPTAWAVFEQVRAALEAVGPFEVRATKSQVAFRRGRGCSWHHLELGGPEQVDDEVRLWLREAYDAAGRRSA